MGAPFGNQNAAKAKRWTAAIERALERRATGKQPPEDRSDLIKGLDAAADIFVAELFDKKDLGYFKEFGDRAEGRPTQSIEAEADVRMEIAWHDGGSESPDPVQTPPASD